MVAQSIGCSVQAVPPTSGRLLGFMWTSCANAQFIIVTSSGLKCFTLGRQALHTNKSSSALEDVANAELGEILWHKYQHHSRILLMATQYDLNVQQITGQVCCSHCTCISREHETAYAPAQSMSAGPHSIHETSFARMICLPGGMSEQA
jgi:hypothetical protein